MSNFPKQHRIPPAKLARARQFRRALTPAEAKLWATLRNRQHGYKFRRQYVITPFIVDFYCAAARLVIEVDGGIHATPAQAAYDAARTDWLTRRGYHVVRFTNTQVKHQLEAVLTAIIAECQKRGEQIAIVR